VNRYERREPFPARDRVSFTTAAHQKASYIELGFVGPDDPDETSRHFIKVPLR
jgi:hypothetical protein